MNATPRRRLAILIATVASLLATLAVPTGASALCSGSTTTGPHVAWRLTIDRDPCSPAYIDARGNTIWALVHDGSRFIGVGTDRASAFDTPQAAAFTSTDGRSWTLGTVPFDGARFDQSDLRLATAAGLTVLVGPEVAASSTDGTAWRVGRAPDSGSTIVGAAGRAGRWIAVGFTTRAAGATFWTSTNGRDWSRLRHRSAFDRFCPTDIAANGSTFVAVGSACDNPYGVVLTSRDGLTWTRRTLPTSRDTALRAVTATPTGFLAAGDDESARGVRGSGIWSSRDGASWRRVAFFSAFRAGEAMQRIVVTTAGVVAIADRGGLTDGLGPTAFYSPTGTSEWHRDSGLPNPGYGSEDGDLITGAAASGGRVVVSGWFNDPDPGFSSTGGLFWTGDVRS